MIGSAKRLRRSAVVLTTAMLTVLALLIPATPAKAVGPGIYSVAYSSNLYRYNGYGYPYQLSYGQWQAQGFPRAIRIGSDYVKYPWSDQIYAVTFFGSNQDSWLWQHLDFPSWARAGYPQPRVAGWIEGSGYYKWATSNEVFVQLDGQNHKLTYSEWVASGYQQPELLADQGYMKLSWDSNIAHMYQIGAGNGYQISYSDWAADGFPTPEVRATLPGDRICKFSYTSVLYYEGSSFYGNISWNQWAATGFMTPQYC